MKQLDDSSYNQYITTSFKGFNPEPFHDYILDYKWLAIYSVNVDDIVEKVFARNKKSLGVFEKKRDIDNVQKYDNNLFKLHGSISFENEGYIFSSSEYNELANDTTDYRLLKFIVTLLESPLVVIGTELNEQELDSLVFLYRRASKELISKPMVFINPKPTAYFCQRMTKYPKWKLIEITAEECLLFVHDNKNKIFTNYYSTLQSIKRNGCLSLDLIKKSMIKADAYQSQLYFGYTATWEDAIYGYIVRYMSLSKIIEEIKGGKYRVYALYGRIYTGKSSALKNIFVDLMQMPDCVCLFVDTEELSIGNLKKIATSLTEKNIYLFIDDAADYYSLFDKIYDIDSRISIISISKNSLHSKKRYALEHTNVYEANINEFVTEDIQSVRTKLTEKGLSGILTGKSLRDWEEKIGKCHDITSVIYKVTDSKIFGEYYREYFRENNLKNSGCYSILLAAAILYKAEISYLSRALLYKISITLNDKVINECIDYLQVFDDERLRIVSPSISDAILENASRNDIIKYIIDLTTAISGLVTEKDKNYWKTTYEYLTKYKTLMRIFKFTNKEIFDIYNKIFPAYQDRSYYWLQKGLLEQKENNFELANNHFNSALAIHSTSYAILHAKARNYCKQAIFIGERDKAVHYYEEGSKIFYSLIENYEHKQNKTYSIHSLVFESMEYYKKYKININKNKEREFVALIDGALIKDPDDTLLQDLMKRFFVFSRNISEFNLYEGYEDYIDE